MAGQPGRSARAVDDPEIRSNVPADLRDPGGRWFGLTVRARTIMRSTERVSPSAATTYEDLGDPRWKGRLCLRSGTSDYNVSFVADRHRQGRRGGDRGDAPPLDGQRPQIFGSDTDVLDAVRDGPCDVGLTELLLPGPRAGGKPQLPGRAGLGGSEGRGTHLNLSGLGVVKGTDQRRQGHQLMEYLTEPAQQELFARNNFEFAADPDVKAAGDRAVRHLQARPDRRAGRRRAPGGRAAADAGGWVGLIPPDPAAAGRATVLTAVCALLIAGPLVGLPLSYLVAPGGASKYSNFLPDAFMATGLLWWAWARARSCWARRSPRWCRSATSPAAPGSSGCWCCRWPCRAMCSRSSRSASTCPTCARPAARS